MAGKPDEDEGIRENSGTPASEEKQNEVSKKKQKGVLSWIWNTLFSSRKDDFESRLKHISKEETIILSRMRRRSRGWVRMRRHIILFSLLLEVIAVGYAIMTTRAVEHWRRRAFRVLPMFVVPILSSVMYSTLGSFMNMLNQNDEKTLEKLRSEKKLKIDELKERTNYYITQQLIQKYDTDPAARAAAAAILASKLGSDSGLNVYVGDNPDLTSAKKSHDAEPVQSSGLRNRKQQHNGTSTIGSNEYHSSGETRPHHMGTKIIDHSSQFFVNHHQGQGSSSFGWLDRIVALLVGEDPTQCYALICQNCHMHNGLASKEDFPYVSYICPHCRTLNGPKKSESQVSGSDSQTMGSTTTVKDGKPGVPGSGTNNFEEDGKFVSNTGAGSVVPGGNENEMSEKRVEEMLSEGHIKTTEMLSEGSEKEIVPGD